MNLLIYALAFIVAVGVLVVIHEFGHFWVARRLGVKVLRFSVGFGKPLWTRRFGRDKTEFVLAAVPLGGYVKMLDEGEGEVPAKERHRAFNRQPVWKRMAVVVAGPAFNFIFAILAYWFVFTTGIEGIKPVVGHVLDGSRAAQAGFRKGDELLTVNGKDVLTWDHRRLYFFERALDKEKIVVEVRDADGQRQTRTLDLTDYPTQEVNASLLERGIGLIGYMPQALPVIGELLDGPAKRVGFEVGDRIKKIDGKSVETWDDIVKVIRAAPGRSLRVTVERNGALHEIDVVPESRTVNNEAIGQIGVFPRSAELPPGMLTKLELPLWTAFTESLADTWSMSRLTLEMLYRMVRLQVSTKTISGPLTIAQYAGVSAQVGFNHFVMFLAVVSIGLGVLNLLPVPVLDGGHLLYFSIEAIKGSPLSEKAMMAGQRIGIVLLMCLMALAFYNDITRIFR